KTGTTDGKGDAWFIGATPQLAASVWFGNRTTNSLPAGFGGDVAAPIWRAFMQDALDGLPDIPLPDRGSNAVCNRPGRTINPDGGHGGPVAAPAPRPAPAPAPQNAPVVTEAPPTASAPAAPAPVTPVAPIAPPALPNGNGNGPGPGNGNGNDGR